MKVPLLDLKTHSQPLHPELSDALQRVLDTQQFCLGQAVRDFEQAAQEWTGGLGCLGVSSGTDALLMALMALEIGPGDEVIVPAFTFFASAAVVCRVGATPVFVDIEEDTFNIDATQLEESITSRTKAIMPVHMFGQCAKMEAILPLAEKHGLSIIEDAAQALGARRNGQFAGSFGHLAGVSFYPTKNLGACGDAGMIMSKDETLLRKCSVIRNQGMEPRYIHQVMGGNFRMDGFQGAVLGVKLKQLQQWNHRRSEIAAEYDRALANSAVITPFVTPGNTHIYHQYSILTPKRDGLQAHLHDHGVGTGIYYPQAVYEQPCLAHLQVPSGHCPVAERVSRQVLSIPMYPELKPEQIEYVAAKIASFT